MPDPSRIASEAAFDPVVAFGLEAVTFAMKAKTRQLLRGDGQKLREARESLMPDDAAARDAVDHFMVQAEIDPEGAGAALHNFILDWRVGAMRLQAALTEATLRAHVPHQFGPKHHDWQDRRDCGAD